MKPYDFTQILQQHLSVRTETRLNVRLYLAFKDSIITVQPKQAFKAPSTRFLSENLAMSRDTVEKAFQYLEQEQWMIRKQGKGSFILPRPVASKTQTAQINEGFVALKHSNMTEQPSIVAQDYVLATQTEQLDDIFFDQNLHFFADGMPEIRNFPFKKWFETEKHALKTQGLTIFLKDQSAGVALLQQQIAQLSAIHRQIQVEPEQVLIINSTQQALYLCSRVLFDPEDLLLMENPYYSNAKQVFELANLNIRHVAVDQEGMNIEADLCQQHTQQMEQLHNKQINEQVSKLVNKKPTSKAVKTAKAPKAIYITPANQFPSTVQMSLKRRQDLVDYAQQQQCYLIEDDYDALMLAQPSLPAVFSLDHHQRTIYIGSMSKYILPSLRISYMILPKQLIAPFHRYRNIIDGSAPSQYSQVLLALFMQQGHYARYLTHMQQLYASRYQSFIFNFNQYLGEYCYLEPYQASMQVACYFHPQWAEQVCEDDLVTHAKQSDIDLTGLSQFYAAPLAPRYGFVLGFSALSESEILVCMQQLGALMHQTLASASQAKLKTVKRRRTIK